MQSRKIDPTNLTESDTNLLVDYSLNNDILVFEKSKTLHFRDDIFQLTHNLILDQEYQNPNVKRYHVISKEPQDVLGQGATSKVRSMLGYIDIDLVNKKIEFTPSDEKALRVKNAKSPYRERRTPDNYSHKQAKEEYSIGQLLGHLGMQKPVKVKKEDPASPAPKHKKSFFVVDRFKGDDFDKAVEDFICDIRPSTATMLKQVILPLLIAYKEQIADKGFVHRDIKPGNIRALIQATGESIFKFIDVEACLKPGAVDKVYGTPGYFAPELKNKELKVHPARDIFALGVLLTASINPELDPERYFGMVREAGVTETAMMAYAFVKEHECYDPDHLVDADTQEPFEFFQFMTDPDKESVASEQHEIKNLLKEMTSVNPDSRPDIDTVIKRLNDILEKLENPDPICRPNVK